MLALIRSTLLRGICPLYSRTLKKQGHKEHVYHLTTPNASAHLLPEAGATQERTLEAVRCSALFGQEACPLWPTPHPILLCGPPPQGLAQSAGSASRLCP